MEFFVIVCVLMGIGALVFYMKNDCRLGGDSADFDAGPSASSQEAVQMRRSEKEAEPKTEEEKILWEIRQINDEIPGKGMSAKIDRIEELTRRILTYQKECPEQAGQLRSFLDYYLPTTLKILRSYARLDAQDVDGENISAAKSRIEGMMDQVVTGFEKQLDRLFQQEAMSVTTEVEVLENMLKKDGLSEDELTLIQ